MLFHAGASAVWLIAAAILVVAFIIVVRIHEQALRAAAELRQRLGINETQLARLDRRWDLVPDVKIEVPSQYEAVANDLDLFGHASLYQLISQANTPFGCDTLRDWLIRARIRRRHRRSSAGRHVSRSVERNPRGDLPSRPHARRERREHVGLCRLGRGSAGAKVATMAQMVDAVLHNCPGARCSAPCPDCCLPRPRF